MNGRYISGPAALFILLFFFLPWIIVSCNGRPIGELSGYDLARGSLTTTQADTIPIQGQPLLFTIPAVSLITLSLIALVWRSPHLAARRIAWGQASIAVTTLLILLWQYLQLQPAQESVYELITQPALWGTLIGLLLILTGAVVDIVSHYRTPGYAHSTNKSPVAATPKPQTSNPLKLFQKPQSSSPDAKSPHRNKMDDHLFIFRQIT